MELPSSRNTAANLQNRQQLKEASVRAETREATLVSGLDAEWGFGSSSGFLVPILIAPDQLLFLTLHRIDQSLQRCFGVAKKHAAVLTIKEMIFDAGKPLAHRTL